MMFLIYALFAYLPFGLLVTALLVAAGLPAKVEYIPQVIILSIILTALSKGERFKFHLADYFLVIFVILVGLSAVFVTADVDRSSAGLITYLTFPAAYIAGRLIHISREKTVSVLLIGSISLVIASVVALLIRGFTDPNELGIYAAMFLIYVLGRRKFVLFLPVLALATLFSFSKTAMVVIAVGLLTYFYHETKSWTARARKILIGSYVGMLIGIVIIISGLLPNDGVVYSDAVNSFDVFLSNPLGIGAGARTQTDGLYLEVLVTLGFVALTVLLAFFIETGRSLVRQSNANFAILLGLLAGSLFLNVFAYPAVAAAFGLLLGIGFTKKAR